MTCLDKLLYKHRCATISFITYIKSQETLNCHDSVSPLDDATGQKSPNGVSKPSWLCRYKMKHLVIAAIKKYAHMLMSWDSFCLNVLYNW